MITQEELPIVAIPSMNNTHLEEMIIINKLDSAARNDKVEEVSKILKELLEHTRIHFFNEEKMMKESLFLDYEIHKSTHDRYIRELESTVKYFEKHKDTRAIYSHIEGNLTAWMINHVQTMDTIAAKFINKELLT